MFTFREICQNGLPSEVVHVLASMCPGYQRQQPPLLNMQVSHRVSGVTSGYALVLQLEWAGKGKVRHASVG